MQMGEIIINVTPGDLLYLCHCVVSFGQSGDELLNVRSVCLDREAAFICSRKTPHKLRNIQRECGSKRWLCLCHGSIMPGFARNCKREI